MCAARAARVRRGRRVCGEGGEPRREPRRASFSESGGVDRAPECGTSVSPDGEPLRACSEWRAAAAARRSCAREPPGRSARDGATCAAVVGCAGSLLCFHVALPRAVGVVHTCCPMYNDQAVRLHHMTKTRSLPSHAGAPRALFYLINFKFCIWFVLSLLWKRLYHVISFQPRVRAQRLCYDRTRE